MSYTVANYIKYTEQELSYWVEGVKSIIAGTYDFDGNMSRKRVKELHKHKTQVFFDALNYLKGLPNDLVIVTENGRTEEGSKYFKIINS